MQPQENLKLANTGEHAFQDSAPMPSTLGGPFELTDHSGQTVTDQTYQGEWLLMYFGYVRCNIACRVAIAGIGKVIDELGEVGKKLRPIFVDFDFKRTSQEELAEYVGAIHPRLIGLRGTRRQIFLISRAYKVRRQHSTIEYKPAYLPKSKYERGYRINHTTRIYLVGPDGVVANYYYETIEPQELAADIRRRMG